MIKKPANARQDPASDAATVSAPLRTKAERSAAARARRRHIFVETYLSNGNNAAQAAIAVGVGGKRPRAAGWKLLHHPEVQRMIAARARHIAELAGMTTESWARELSAVAFSSIGDIYRPDGALRPVCELAPHVQAAIASVKMTPDGSAVEYKFWDKIGALQIMARHLGLFEKDNRQIGEDIQVNVVLVP